MTKQGVPMLSHLTLSLIVMAAIAWPLGLALQRAGRRPTRLHWLLVAVAVAAACAFDPTGLGFARVDGVLFGAGCLPAIGARGL